MKESFGVEQRKSAAASPTKQIERNPIFELEKEMKRFQLQPGEGFRE